MEVYLNTITNVIVLKIFLFTSFLLLNINLLYYLLIFILTTFILMLLFLYLINTLNEMIYLVIHNLKLFLL